MWGAPPAVRQLHVPEEHPNRVCSHQSEMRGKPNCWAVHPVVLRVRERVRTARETPHRMKTQGWSTFCIVKLMSGKPWVSWFFFFPSSLWAFALLTIHNTLSQRSDHPDTPDTFQFLWLLSLTFLNFYFLLLFLQQYTCSRHPLSPFGYSSLFSSAFPSSSVTSTLFSYSSQHFWAFSSSSLLIFSWWRENDTFVSLLHLIALLFGIPLLNPLIAFTSKVLILSIFTHGC